MLVHENIGLKRIEERQLTERPVSVFIVYKPMGQLIVERVTGRTLHILGSTMLWAMGCASPSETKPTAMAEPMPNSMNQSPHHDQATSSVKLPLHIIGDIDLPTGGKAPTFYVRLDRDEHGPTGRISIPDQKVKDKALANVQIEEHLFAFEMAEAGAQWKAERTENGVTCTFKQGGMSFPCSMRFVSADDFELAQAKPRPQTPKPPFPYDIEDVRYANGDVELAGTLTLPKGGSHGAALLITGSGQHDRDETVFGHKPFWVIADHLSRNGIAVLRVDDRGIGGSTGLTVDLTMLDFASDVRASIAYLRQHERIDPDKVGLIGHSEGGVIAGHVAAEDDRVAFVVSLAGSGVPGGDVLVEQSAALMRASGAPEAVVNQRKAMQAEIMAVVRTTVDENEARERLTELLKRAGAPESTADKTIKSLLSPWYRTFVKYDPAPDFAKLKVPVLVLVGSRDTQVVAEQNIPPLEQALAGNDAAQVERLEGLNHLFQPAKTGLPSEYETIDETIAPQVLDKMSTFVQGVVK